MTRHPYPAPLRPQRDVPAQPVTPTSRLSPRLRHDRLVRGGAILLLVAVALIAAHLLIDTTVPDQWSFWAYTLGSYETAFILAIVGLALVLREPPGGADESQ